MLTWFQHVNMVAYLHKKGLMLERSGDLALWASLTALETISQLRCPLSKKDRVRLRSRPFVTVMTKYGDASCDQYSIHFRGLRRYNRRPPVYFCTVPVSRQTWSSFPGREGPTPDIKLPTMQSLCAARVSVCEAREADDV